jgi:hypothetical protein
MWCWLSTSMFQGSRNEGDILKTIAGEIGGPMEPNRRLPRSDGSFDRRRRLRTLCRGARHFAAADQPTVADYPRQPAPFSGRRRDVSIRHGTEVADLDGLRIDKIIATRISRCTGNYDIRSQSEGGAAGPLALHPQFVISFGFA